MTISASRQYDQKTLRALIKEAETAHRKTQKLFEKHDSVEDMHESDRWRDTVTWLTSKLESK